MPALRQLLTRGLHVVVAAKLHDRCRMCGGTAVRRHFCSAGCQEQWLDHWRPGPG